MRNPWNHMDSHGFPYQCKCQEADSGESALSLFLWLCLCLSPPPPLSVSLSVSLSHFHPMSLFLVLCINCKLQTLFSITSSLYKRPPQTPIPEPPASLPATDSGLLFTLIMFPLPGTLPGVHWTPPPALVIDRASLHRHFRNRFADAMTSIWLDTGNRCLSVK